MFVSPGGGSVQTQLCKKETVKASKERNGTVWGSEVGEQTNNGSAFLTNPLGTGPV